MKIAFVAPFYGANAAGGAESECRQTAIHLARAGLEVEILTSCLLDLQHDWNVNVHEAGLSYDGPVTVRRFYVEPTDLTLFSELNGRLIRGESLTEAEEQLFAACHITSCDLLRYLSQHAGNYHALLFIPYPFGTTLFGLPLCSERAVLIPCLHDEGYARMRIVGRVFDAARRLIFHTQAEKILHTDYSVQPPKKALCWGKA